MRKRLVATIVLLSLSILLLLPACVFDRLIGIDQNSEVSWVEASLPNGRKYRLDDEQMNTVVDSIKGAGTFKAIDEYLPNDDYEIVFDYTLVLNVKRKQFFKKVDTKMTYHLGATVIYDDESKSASYKGNIWMLDYNGMYLAGISEEESIVLRELLDSLLENDRQNHYNAIKNNFIDSGYDIEDLTKEQIAIEYTDANSQNQVFEGEYGFVATKQSTGERYSVYRAVDQENARNFASATDGSRCSDVFVGFGKLSDSSILNGLL